MRTDWHPHYSLRITLPTLATRGIPMRLEDGRCRIVDVDVDTRRMEDPIYSHPASYLGHSEGGRSRVRTCTTQQPSHTHWSSLLSVERLCSWNHFMDILLSLSVFQSLRRLTKTQAVDRSILTWRPSGTTSSTEQWRFHIILNPLVNPSWNPEVSDAASKDAFASLFHEQGCTFPSGPQHRTPSSPRVWTCQWGRRLVCIIYFW